MANQLNGSASSTNDIANEGSQDAASAAERLMAQHGSPAGTDAPSSHLSYAEREEVEQRRATTSNQSGRNGARLAGDGQPDFGSEAAFPSLGTPSAGTRHAGGWGSGPALSARLNLAAQASRNAPASARGSAPKQERASAAAGPTFTEPLVLDAKSIAIGPVPAQYRDRGPRAAGEKREADPQTLTEVIRVVQRRHPSITIESSTSREKVSLLFRTPISLPPKSPGASLSPEERVAHARNELVARVSKRVTLSVSVPGFVRPFIIGARGKTLKQIVDDTGADIQIPRREAPDTIVLNGHEQSEDDVDAAPVTITISGEEYSAQTARDQILAIVEERTSRTTERITSIPPEDYRLINGVKGAKMAALIAATVGASDGDEPDVSVYVPSIRPRASHHDLLTNGMDAPEAGGRQNGPGQTRDNAIVVSGHKNLVGKVAEAIENAYADLKRTLRSFEIDVPKRQHRLVVQAADEIFEATGSIVEAPMPSDSTEKITIRGEQMANVQALQSVVEKANAMSIDTLDLAIVHRKGQDSSSTYARDVARYLIARGRLRAVQDAHSEVKIFVPKASDTQARDIEFVGKRKEDVTAARATVLEVVKDLPPESFAAVDIDPLAHSHLIGRKGARIRALKDSRGVDVIFPPEGQQRSDVLLVFCGKDGSSSQRDAGRESLQSVTAELQKLASEIANIKSTSLSIPSKFHGYILGSNGTTLNAIIGETRAVHVAVGSSTKPPNPAGTVADASDQVVIRGPADEVARVAQEIRRLAEEAEHQDTINSFMTEFEIDSKHVGHIVGKAGAGIIRLREELGVRVDFADAVSEPSSRKRKSKSVVTIKGRKENVNEARKRILNQSERLADETTLYLPIPSGVDRGGLLGKGGKYILRLQDAHSVFITVPRASIGDDADGQGDTIAVRGPKKGCEAAKKELTEAMEYDREQNSSDTLEVPSRLVPRILGKAGSSIDRIKESSGAQDIDVRRNGESSTITIRGASASVEDARRAILAIVEEAESQVTVELEIHSGHHQSLIGRGGTKVREIVRRAGGDPEARIVRFPRQGEISERQNTVVLQGPEPLVLKVKAELEKEVTALEERICLGVAVPRDGHAAIIGRGAAGIKELQRIYQVTIAPPGWREWNTAGEPTNALALKNCDEADIIKIIGSASACQAAAQAIQSRKPREFANKVSISVPVKHHAVLVKSGVLQKMPRGVRVDYGGAKGAAANVTLPPKRPIDASYGRIDDDSVENTSPLHWDIHDLDVGESAENTIPWTITATSRDDVTTAEDLMLETLRTVQRATRLAYATIHQGMGRVVGRGGSGLNTLKATGAFVEVAGRTGADTIVVVGQPDQLAQVKSLIEGLLR